MTNKHRTTHITTMTQAGEYMLRDFTTTRLYAVGGHVRWRTYPKPQHCPQCNGTLRRVTATHTMSRACQVSQEVLKLRREGYITWKEGAELVGELSDRMLSYKRIASIFRFLRKNVPEATVTAKSFLDDRARGCAWVKAFWAWSVIRDLRLWAEKDDTSGYSHRSLDTLPTIQAIMTSREDPEMLKHLANSLELVYEMHHAA